MQGKKYYCNNLKSEWISLHTGLSDAHNGESITGMLIISYIAYRWCS
jgi:hypothetical protein